MHSHFIPHEEAMRHGGGLGAATVHFPSAVQPWLDLSTGINPVPWNSPQTLSAKLNSLPDPQDLQQLETTAAAAFSSHPERTSAIAGAETAIRLLPLMIGSATVDIVEPTYGAHREAWMSSAMAPNAITSDQIQSSRADVLVLVNPNNPDGRLYDKTMLRHLALQRQRQGQWLIVDESFIECTPEASIADLDCDRLIVLRSFGKFFGLAGLRLGFMISSPEIKHRLRQLTGDWPVSGQAIAMGSAAYADVQWQAQTRQALFERSRRLQALLVESGFTLVGGTSLFQLAHSIEARDWFGYLCGQGILTRPFANRPNWLRFGVPSEADFPRLEQALQGRT